MQSKLDEAEKEGKKYILQDDKSGYFRIIACKDFSDVKKGEFGGLIESEKNLSHKGNCWLYENAHAVDNA